MNPVEHLSRGDAARDNGTDAELASLRKRLLRHARRALSDRDSAEDLVQETLFAVFRDRSSCRGEASLDTWALAILRHKIADWYRSPSRRLLTGFDEAGTGGLDDFGDGGERVEEDEGLQRAGYTRPDWALEQRELASALEACIGRLSGRSRQVFTMRERLGFETDEVCERLGISQDNCRMLLHRARVALRGELLARSLAP